MDWQFKTPVHHNRSSSTMVHQRANKWFVLRTEEGTLKKLEETWDTLSLPRRWKLEPLLRYADSHDSPLESWQDVPHLQVLCAGASGESNSNNCPADPI